jgi:hypothetical protein
LCSEFLSIFALPKFAGYRSYVPTNVDFLANLRILSDNFGQTDFYFFFLHTNNSYWVILYATALLCFPKNLTSWRDSKPGLLAPEVDAMSTAPRRQGILGKRFRPNSRKPFFGHFFS